MMILTEYTLHKTCMHFVLVHLISNTLCMPIVKDFTIALTTYHGSSMCAVAGMYTSENSREYQQDQQVVRCRTLVPLVHLQGL